ncbi:tRNA (adenine(22)-N(1))-methyltransferase [Williamsoniiplasma lucivorax]|uniref:tRNA (Adenine22-N1)-methyltransferase n=1 Tax=Williamsoniiplasma lucivorax TaxID=209274 RepID=A0A2S5RDJ4_9MOLU|nr:class I SAM-dependent methyltransferase [Williamsoniiplasma lucivorax]PPE05195.1 tRNA (adenine22-N1)-methyltransferase [Williamsoniiplasma lucivorax]
MLSKRLKNLADLVIAGDFVAIDVGTDHGLLPIHLIKNQIVKKVYAADINSEPLKSAHKNIKKHHLEQQIIPVLSDGLAFVQDIDDEIEYCFIAGLGASTIKEILSNDHHKIKNYLICANTEISALRQFANDCQYLVKYETFFVDHKHHYWLIWISKTPTTQLVKNLTLGDFKWFINNQEYQKYLLNQIKFFERIVQKINQEDNVRQGLEQKIVTIKEYVKLWN